MIELKDITYVYEKNGPDEIKALKGVNVTVNDGDFLAVIGHTGSGKSTLSEIMSGLLRPTGGSIILDGKDITGEKSIAAALRGKVGMVFQYPEHQLFEETVIKDICFGPGNMGLDEKECLKRAQEAMKLVGLGKEYENLSPFELSGGEKRRVAIAGVAAMRPDVLILDEPTAGLDPVGKNAILDSLKKIKGEWCKSIVLVSHSMEDVARCADKAVVMNKGEAILQGSVREIFEKSDVLIRSGLDVPQITRLVARLGEKGFGFDDIILTVEDAAEAIYDKLR